MVVEQVFPVFEEGRILKKDTLDMVRDYAPDFFSILGRDYGNGIITGFQVTGCEGGIAVAPGILKDKASFFLMKERAVLPYEMYGSMVQVVLRKLGTRDLADYRIERFELILRPLIDDSDLGNTGGEGYELGRFRLDKGAKLRAYEDYRDLYDMVTEFNTLNIVHVKYACEHGSSLSPYILRMFGRGILSSRGLEPIDASFAVACLNSPVVSAELLMQYLSIKCRTGALCEENEGRYRGLLQIYSQLVLGSDVRAPAGRKSGRTVID